MPRAKAFDREEALQKAMETFWRFGYEATSIQDLVESMGINRGSLYDTFGDKRSLFQAAIAHYNCTVVKEAIAELEAPGASKAAIVAHFRNAAEQAATDSQQRGCLITNCAVEIAPHDSEIAASVAETMRRVERALHGALVRAREQGEIDASLNLEAIARYFTCCLQGLRVVSKTNPNPDDLREIAELALAILD